MNKLVYLLAVIALVACTEKPKEITSSIFSTAEDTIAEADTTASVDTIPAVVDTPKVVPVLKKEIKQKDTVAAPKRVEKPNQAYDADSVLARHSRSGGTNMGCNHKGECVGDDDDGPVLNTLDEVDTVADTLAAFPEEEELPEEEEDESEEEYLPEDEEDDFAKEFENTEYDEGKDDFDL